MWEYFYTPYLMIKDAFIWLIIVEALFFTLLFASSLFAGIYVFGVEMPGMLFNSLLAGVEGIISTMRAKKLNWSAPITDEHVYYYSKKDRFLGMVREIRCLINKWALLYQNGVAVIMFGFIFGSITIFLIYALSQGADVGGGATILDYGNQLVEFTPYAFILFMLAGIIYGCFVVISIVWMLFKFYVLGYWNKNSWVQLRENYKLVEQGKESKSTTITV